MESLVKGFKENKAFRFTSLLVVLLLAITLLAPVIAPHDPLTAVMRMRTRHRLRRISSAQTSSDVTCSPVSSTARATP